MNDLKSIILKYYELVDLSSFEEMFDLFSENIIYIRGEKIISNINNLKDFYLNKRKIKGNHTITEMNILNQQIIVKGTFNGTNYKNDKINVGFSDYFYFDNNNKINRRETFLANGFKLIK